MTSIICLLKLVHLNELLFDEWVDHVFKEVLKLSIFVVQKAAAPKNGVEFCQGSYGTISSSLAMSHDVVSSSLHLILVVFVLFNILRHLNKTGNGIIAMWPNTMTSLSVLH